MKFSFENKSREMGNANPTWREHQILNFEFEINQDKWVSQLGNNTPNSSLHFMSLKGDTFLI